MHSPKTVQNFMGIVIFFLQSIKKKKDRKERKKGPGSFSSALETEQPCRERKWSGSHKGKLLFLPKLLLLVISNFRMPLLAGTFQAKPTYSFRFSVQIMSYSWQSLIIFIHFFMQQILIRHILWPRSPAKNWGCIRAENNSWCPLGSRSSIISLELFEFEPWHYAYSFT